MGVKSLRSQQLDIYLDQTEDMRWDPQMKFYTEMNIIRLRDHHWEGDWGQSLEFRYPHTMEYHVGMKMENFEGSSVVKSL